jgi:hypothetical protein
MEVTDTDAINIRSVIEYQLAAFKNDDAQSAFSFASPAIQAQFGTAEHFKLPSSIPSSVCLF